ncbi:MAG: PAS domain S-box protein [Thermodesulfobacteriota bacterium]
MNVPTGNRFPFSFTTILSLVLFVIVVLVSAHFRWKLTQEFLLHQKLSTIAGELNRYEFERRSTAIKTMARCPALTQVLKSGKSDDHPNAIHVLETLRSAVLAEMVYLMDRNGKVVACASVDKGKTLIGSNYAFSPYFTRAINGETSFLPALRINTHERGLYTSSPVVDNDTGEVIGVLVSKCGMMDIDRLVSGVDHLAFALTSPEGVVLAASNPQWWYHPLQPLSEERRSALIAAEQLTDKPLDPLPKNEWGFSPNFADLENMPPHRLQRMPVIMGHGDVHPWSVVGLNLTPYPVVDMAFYGGIAFVLGGLIFVFLFAWRKKQFSLAAKQQELLESKQHLSATLSSITDGVISCDVSGAIVHLNAAAEALTGWTHTEAVGKPVNEVFRLVHAQPLETQENPIFHAIREGTVVHLVAHPVLVDKHGTGHPIETTCAPIRNAAGSVTGVVLVFRDMTEQHRRLEELRKSQLITDNLPIGLYLFHLEDLSNDRTFRLVYANPVVKTLTGVEPEWIVGKTLDENFPGLREQGIPQRYAEVVRNQIPIAFEDITYGDSRMPLASYAVNAFPLPGDHVAVVFQNITDRKRTEEALKTSEAGLRAITDSAQDAIIKMDASGKITFWNPAAERILGYSPEEALGQDVHQLLAPERFHTAYLAALQNFQRTGSGAAVGKTIELEAKRKDGREITVAMSLSAIHVHDEWHAVGILRDVTERKRIEMELLDTNRQLEAAINRANEMAVQAEIASMAKSEFLANMSHEIRTPMNGVLGMTELLLDTDLTGEQRRYAETIKSSGEALLTLINDILDFSKIEAGKLDLENLDFDLQSLLDDFAMGLALKAHDKGLEFTCAADPDVPLLLRGDPGRLRQILTNLAGNAVKFTHQGEVAIRVSKVQDDACDMMQNSCILRFSVRDTGIGIPTEKIDMIFEKFTQADTSTTRHFGGTGLGLAISKQLAELMGGKIEVKSTPGQGSEFWFTTRFEKQPGSAQLEPGTQAVLRNARVLIVDDSATNREILTALLSSWGMRPEGADAASSALDMLHKALPTTDPFQVALIDMHMPGMDGMSLGRAIKANPLMENLRMVMLTSLGTRGEVKTLKEIGFTGYLTKPVRCEELRGVLTLALAGQCGTGQQVATRHTVREVFPNFSKRNVRILLADDNLINQQVALGILKKLGYQADIVGNGREVLDALKTASYDLIFMDVQMPEMDGLEAVRHIRDPNSPIFNRNVPIIAMTAHDTREDRENCLEAGMNDYVTKPVTAKVLAEVLEKWLTVEQNER